MSTVNQTIFKVGVAIKTGKIQSGEAKLKGLRLELEEIFRMEVDISIIKQDGTFDNPPFIPFEWEDANVQ